MNRMKWKVMKAFNLLPFSPIVRKMNEIQWSWCYLNIIKDEEEEEKKWKDRLTYLGFLNNPQFTNEYLNTTNGFNNASSNSNSHYNDNSNGDEYKNTDFEKELFNALQNEQFIEIPEEGGMRGDPVISSDDFINMLDDNIDKFSELQQHIDLERQSRLNNNLNNDLNNDLDIIEVDDDDEDE